MVTAPTAPTAGLIRRPGRPGDARPNARPRQWGYLAEIGRMHHKTALEAGETCRWCTNRLTPRSRRDAVYLECPRCDQPGNATPATEETE